MVDFKTDQALYEWVFERKWNMNYSWQRISDALQWGLNNNSSQKKYRRLCNDLNMPYKPKKVAVVVNHINTQTQNVQPAIDPLILISRKKYGEIEPTDYVSSLSHDDWNDEYVDYVMKDKINDLKITRKSDPQLYKVWQKKWRLKYITELSNTIWDEKQVLVLLPRRYGKTERMIVLFARWILEKRKSLYIVVPSGTHGKKIMRKINSILRNPRVRRDYGDVGTKPVYDADMYYMEYHQDIDWYELDFPLSIVTWNSAKEGAGPSWLHYEDVWQKAFKNVDSNNDIEDTYDNTFEKMLPDKETATGTRYGHPKDFYSMLRDKYKWKTIHYEALPDDEKSWLECPNYTKEVLKNMKKNSPSSFATKMNNNPVPSQGEYFDINEFKEVEDVELPHFTQMQYYIVVDPARGMSDSADNTAILVIGISEGCSWVVDGFVGKIDDDEKEKKVNRFYVKYNPVNTLIETTFAQIDFKRFQHIRGVVQYRDTQKKAKIVRISATKSYWADNLIKVRKNMQPHSFLRNEYLMYNETQSTTTRKDDTIDAVSIFIQQFGRLLEFSEDVRQAQSEWSGEEEFYITG
jgi:hypothetical protein